MTKNNSSQTTVMKQCEYGTAKAGNVNMERCEKEADKEYLGYGEDRIVHLCEEHYDEFHRGDFYSKR
jgi:hypothetical protein